MPRAAYRSPLREKSAAQTHEAILDAGLRLFAQDGYATVTVEQIARAAGVATPTVYASVGGKRELLLALCRQATDSPLADAAATSLADARTPRQVIDVLVGGARTLNERHAATMRIASEAHSVPEAHALWTAGLQRTHALCDITARRLAQLDGLRAGLTTQEATTTLTTLVHPLTLRTLTDQLGLSWDAAERWLREACLRLLTDVPSRP